MLSVGSALWGWWTDRWTERRIPFLLCLIVSAGAVLMIWLGPTITVQLIGRLLQGAAAAMIWITGMAMIADAAGHADVGKYIGYISIAMMVPSMTGTEIQNAASKVVAITTDEAIKPELT